VTAPLNPKLSHIGLALTISGSNVAVVLCGLGRHRPKWQPEAKPLPDWPSRKPVPTG
jgi:hypothetical protein